MKTTDFATREEWLIAAVAALDAVVFANHDIDLPPVRVSVGWPGGRGRKDMVIGQCWKSVAATDEVPQLFISPVLDDAARVLDVLAHELIHAVDDCTSGHRGAFARIAKAIGLEGKMTATVAGPELAGLLAGIVEEIGAYPHAALSNAVPADGPKKQGTRMLKAECPEGSGYNVRLTQKWLDEVGAPICPCHNLTMDVA